MLLVKLELTPDDVERFKEFRRYEDIFRTLHQAGVFDIKSGSVELHFNQDGILMDIIRPKMPLFHRPPIAKKE